MLDRNAVHVAAGETFFELGGPLQNRLAVRVIRQGLQAQAAFGGPGGDFFVALHRLLTGRTLREVRRNYRAVCHRQQQHDDDPHDEDGEIIFGLSTSHVNPAWPQTGISE